MKFDVLNKIDKNRTKIRYILLFVFIGLVTAMIFFGFAPLGMWKNEFNRSVNLTLFQYITCTGVFRSIADWTGGLFFRGVYIAALALMIAVIVAVAILVILKFKDVTNRRADMVMFICIASIIGLITIVLFMGRFFIFHEAIDVDLRAEYGKDLYLGWGGIVSGTLGVLAFVSMFGWFYLPLICKAYRKQKRG